MSIGYEVQCRAFVETEMTTDSAHDMLHIMRVVKTARDLCDQEKANREIILPAAWLHDCFAYPKNHPKRRESSSIAADKAIAFLDSIGYEKSYLNEIHHAIVAHSFSANVVPKTIEAKIVQDADRLDSLGAVGIARTMIVGSTFNVPLYHANDPFCENRLPDDQSFMIDHFYSKLFKLIDSLNTEAARQEGKRRTQFMSSFLQQLNREIV